MLELKLNTKYLTLLTLAALGILTSEQIAQGETVGDQPAETQAILRDNFQQLTSATRLINSPANPKENQGKPTGEIAQTEIEIDPGTTTRSGSSYIGLGGNIGIDGETTVGETSYALISKIGLTDYLSFRPSAIVEENATFLFPVTIDFLRREVSDTNFRLAPYVGGGLSIATGDGDTVGLIATGGLDIPISSRFTANTAINAKFIDSTDIGIILGLGYNF